MREGSKWKLPRLRKQGGGDLYIEERYLRDIRAKLGETPEYTVYAVKGHDTLIVSFRRSKGPQ